MTRTDRLDDIRMKHADGALPDNGHGDVMWLLSEVDRLRKEVGPLQCLAWDAWHVIGNLIENGTEQGFGFYDESGGWVDGREVHERLLEVVDEVDA